MKSISRTRSGLAIAWRVMGTVLLLAGTAAAESQTQAVLRDDLYVAGRDVVVSRDVGGDLVAAGGVVVVNGRVAQDALVAGGSVKVMGDVGDVLRVGGGEVSVGGHVGGYLVAGGGSVELLPTGLVEGGVFVNAGEAMVNGTVRGPLEIRGGEARINGTVEGDVKVYAGKVSLGERALLKKGIEYVSRHEATVASGAQVLGTMRRLPQVPGARVDRSLALVAVPAIVKFLGLIAAGIAIVLLFPGFSRAVTNESLSHFSRDVVIGGGVLVLVPVVAFLLVVSLIGLPLGVLGGLAYAILVLVSTICAGLFLGTLVWRRVMTEKEPRVDWKTAVVGLALLPAVAWIPFLGWFAWAALVMAALGSLSLLAYRSLWPVQVPHGAGAGMATPA